MHDPIRPPTLSVVIPYYRGSGVIRAAVQSILGQTRPADEIVICDDGSPDDLRAALGPLAQRVGIVRKDNGGIASAMNAATAAAGGDFVVQLDQDDVFLPRRLEAISSALADRRDADVVATDAIIEYAGERVATLSDVQPFLAEDQRVAILHRCFFLWPAIRRSRLVAIGGYDESFAVMQDWECFIRLLLDGAAVAYVDEPLYCWRLTPGSRSSADGVANATALIHMITKTLNRPGLTARERAAAEQALAWHRRRLLSERALLAIETCAADARRQAWAMASASGFPPSTRAKAAIATLSPRLARSLLARRDREQPTTAALVRRGFSPPGDPASAK